MPKFVRACRVPCQMYEREKYIYHGCKNKIPRHRRIRRMMDANSWTAGERLRWRDGDSKARVCKPSLAYNKQVLHLIHIHPRRGKVVARGRSAAVGLLPARRFRPPNPSLPTLRHRGEGRCRRTTSSKNRGPRGPRREKGREPRDARQRLGGNGWAALACRYRYYWPC